MILEQALGAAPSQEVLAMFLRAGAEAEHEQLSWDEFSDILANAFWDAEDARVKQTEDDLPPEQLAAVGINSEAEV